MRDNETSNGQCMSDAQDSDHPASTRPIPSAAREILVPSFVPLLLSGLLIVASSLKAWDSISGGLLFNGAVNPNLARLTIAFEFIVGVAGILVTNRAWPMMAMACLFAILLGVAGIEMIRGTDVCGCLGSVPAKPVHMVAVDTCALLALTLGIRKRMKRAKACPSTITSYKMVMLISAIGLGITFVVWPAGLNQETTPDDLFVDSRTYAILEPQRWLGHKFPLANHIDIGATVAEGDWRIVLYRPGCKDCQELIQGLSGQNSESRKSMGRLALIAVPPDVAAGNVVPPALELPDVVAGHLDSSRSWFVRTPCELFLRDGVVVTKPLGVSSIVERH